MTTYNTRHREKEVLNLSDCLEDISTEFFEVEEIPSAERIAIFISAFASVIAEKIQDLRYEDQEKICAEISVCIRSIPFTISLNKKREGIKK